VETKTTSGPIHTTLPWPPSVNHYWKSNGTRRFISPQAKQWLEEAIWLLKQAKGGRPPIAGEVAVFVIAWPPDRRRRDLDNLLKAILDALVKAGALQDDHQVAEVHLVRRAPEKPGRVQVVLEVRDAEHGKELMARLEQAGYHPEQEQVGEWPD
jgi:crossover junction endodeoxyribonuclease RusA